MKKLAIVAGVLSLVIATPTARAWEPAAGMTTPQILQAASTHVIEGKLAEAHDEFTWLYEHGMAEEAGEPGISQAILLPQWAKLARHYPPAMERVLRAPKQPPIT